MVLRKPAILPIVLISAIPAAAAVPLRKRDGMAQKLGKAEKIAQAVTVIIRIVVAGVGMKSAAGNGNGTNKCWNTNMPWGAHRALQHRGSRNRER